MHLRRQSEDRLQGDRRSAALWGHYGFRTGNNRERSEMGRFCVDNVKKSEENSISRFRIQNTETLNIEKYDLDLMELLIIRLGDQDYAENNVLDFLHAVFTGNRQRVLEHLPESTEEVRQEVYELFDLTAYAEERGEKRGEERGEEKFARLIAELLKCGRTEDIQRASEDVKIRKTLYEEFHIC